MRGKVNGKSRLGRILLRLKKEFLWVGFFSLVANVLMLTPTLYMLQVFDRVMQSGNILTLAVLTVIVVFFYTMMAFAEWLRSRLLVRTGMRIDQELNSQVFHASLDSFLKKGDNATVKSFNDLTNIREFLSGQGVIAFFDMPWSPIYIGVMFLLHPYIGMLAVVFALIQAGMAWMSNMVTAGKIEKASELSAASGVYVQSGIRAVESIHVMGMLKHFRRHWIERYEEAVRVSSQAQNSQQRQESFGKFVRMTMQSLTLGAGALLVIDGQMTVGAMIAGNVLMSRALSPLDLMVSTWKLSVQAYVAYKRVNELIVSGDSGGEKSCQKTDGLQGNIEVHGLVATAAGGNVLILDNVTTKIQPGKLTVIVGPSGAGKSTFARALLGIWPETSGEVRIDGIGVEQYSRGKIGPSIGYLPQDVELFDGTIAENIARFQGVDSGKVINAARKVGIHEMILRFSKGYDTLVGEGGRVLSVGQRQRIALARAIYGSPTILVLDEPNANLDESGDRALRSVVREFADGGSTVIMITHRSHILAKADRIIVMEKGRIVREGEPREVFEALEKMRRARAAVSVT